MTAGGFGGPDPPEWPHDLLYIPVASASAADSKAPDVGALPGTWSVDGEGCVEHGETYDRRYGVVDVGVDGWRLLTIDLDLYKLSGEELQTAIDGLDAAPDTRIHVSQSGGKHAFYWIRVEELTDDGSLPVSYAEAIDDKLNGYVLSAEHCEGYEVVNDRQPAEIAVSDLPDEWIEPEQATTDRPDRVRDSSTSVGSGTPSGMSDTEVPAVRDVISTTAHPPGERVAHPLGARHSGGGTSDTGTNFMVDDDGMTWRCWRHDTTGNALHLIGMQEGLIDCGEWDRRTIPAQTWSAVFEAAETKGYISPSARSMDAAEVERKATPDDDDDRQHFDSLEPDLLPEDVPYVLVKPPREGGSYAIMVDFSGRVEDICILASRHHILQYHCETIADLLPSEAAAVHFRGRHTACNADDPGECDKYPRDYDELRDYRQEVRDILYRKTIVTGEDAPAGICPYWFLKEAASEARAVLTVPQLFHRIDRDWSEMNVLIDEEQTNDAFLPGSAELIKIGWSSDAAGNTVIQTQEDNLTSEHETLQKIKEQIIEDQEERKREAEAEGRDWQRTSWEKDILRAVETVKQLRDALALQTFDVDERESLSDVKAALEERLDDVDLPERNTNPDRLKQKINDYCAPFFWDDSVDPSGLLESLLFPYEEQPFHFKRTGGTYTLRLIGDRESYLFHSDILEQTNQIAMIAGPEGERVLDRVDSESETLVIDEFSYADDFIVIPVGKERDDELEPVGRQRNRVKRIAQELNRRSIPGIAVAGTSDQAHDLAAEYLRDEGAAIPADPDSPALTLHTEWSAGNTVGIYENSVVSRGIDAPFFDVTSVTSTGFAAPYWEAKRDHYKTQEGEEADEKYLEAAAVETELKARELTNAALRMAPTYTVDDKYGTKFIIAAASDVNRLKYLQDRIAPRMESVSEVADMVDVLTASGGARLAAEEVYDELGGSEKQFIEVVSEETINPKRHSRPDYALDEVGSWVEDKHVTDREYAERVYRKIQRLGEPTTSELLKRLPSMENHRVEKILEILERKGVIKKLDTENADDGRPANHWTAAGPPL